MKHTWLRDYHPDDRTWLERINPWLFAALLIALYALACVIAGGG